MTEEGKARKEKITDALFHNRDTTLLQLHFYAAVLPLLKEYVLLLQVGFVKLFTVLCSFNKKYRIDLTLLCLTLGFLCFCICRDEIQ